MKGFIANFAVFSSRAVDERVLKLSYFTGQKGPNGDHMKMNSDGFQIQRVRAEKVNEKMASLWNLNYPKRTFSPILC